MKPECPAALRNAILVYLGRPSTTSAILWSYRLRRASGVCPTNWTWDGLQQWLCRNFSAISRNKYAKNFRKDLKVIQTFSRIILLVITAGISNGIKHSQEELLGIRKPSGSVNTFSSRHFWKLWCWIRSRYAVILFYRCIPGAFK